MRFDLVDLHLFLHVAEAGSITAGTERAGLALSSASARGMEETLAAWLTTRSLLPGRTRQRPYIRVIVRYLALDGDAAWNRLWRT